MKTAAIITLWMVFVGWTTPSSATGPLAQAAGGDRPASQGRASDATPSASAITYVPPKRGAPDGRLGGGTRGGSSSRVWALAPDHAGLTAHDQPSLFWALAASGATRAVEVTIVDPRTSRPLLTTRIPAPVKQGFHRLRLADHGVRLERGVPYPWSIVVIDDSSRGARGPLGVGVIELADLDTAVRARIGKADRVDVPGLYAQAGFWYDTLTALSDLIDARPTDEGLRRQRASLLEQVGLGAAAAVDRP